jgi:DHA1 family bicyclomycin/chloramphenicol resistance-like MFS transporter
MHGQTGVAATQPAMIGGIGRPQFIAIVASMMALNALAIDVMLPAFPNIASAASASPTPTGFSSCCCPMSSASALAQLFFGPVSDRFGRRAPLFFGIGLYAACSVAGAFAPSFEFLLISRFLQGIGAAGNPRHCAFGGP